MVRHLLRWMPSPQWAQELDFVGPRISPAPWSWLLLLLGLVALGLVLPRAQALADQQVEAEATLKRLQRAAHQQTLTSRAPRLVVKQGAEAPALLPDTARHAAQLAQWLGYPWLTLLDEVDATAKGEQAVMLGFSLDLATLGSRADSAPDVRLSAAVRDDASALRWVQAQGGSAQLLSRERLSTPFVAAAGQYEWRAEAVLVGGTP